MKTIHILFLFFIFLSMPSLLRAEDSSALVRDVSQKLTVLETKVSQLNTTQTQIIQKHEQIIKELDSLKIWIRRHRS